MRNIQLYVYIEHVYFSIKYHFLKNLTLQQSSDCRPYKYVHTPQTYSTKGIPS